MDSIIINKGECINLTLEWSDETGAAIDVTGRTFTVVDAAPAFTATFAIVDALAGRISMQVEDTSMLRMGDVNRFRVSMTLADGCVDVTPQIGINVQ
jgi:hypothetical protein